MIVNIVLREAGIKISPQLTQVTVGTIIPTKVFCALAQTSFYDVWLGLISESSQSLNINDTLSQNLMTHTCSDNRTNSDLSDLRADFNFCLI